MKNNNYKNQIIEKIPIVGFGIEFTNKEIERSIKKILEKEKKDKGIEKRIQPGLPLPKYDPSKVPEINPDDQDR